MSTAAQNIHYQGRWNLCRQYLYKSQIDHISTTDSRGNNGVSALRKFWKLFASEQKLIKTSGNCYKKHQKSLGKDEVTSSNLVSSSTKKP